MDRWVAQMMQRGNEIKAGKSNTRGSLLLGRLIFQLSGSGSFAIRILCLSEVLVGICQKLVRLSRLRIDFGRPG